MLRALRPDGPHVELSAECPHRRSMEPAGELRRGRIGDEEGGGHVARRLVGRAGDRMVGPGRPLGRARRLFREGREGSSRRRPALPCPGDDEADRRRSERSALLTVDRRRGGGAPGGSRGRRGRRGGSTSYSAITQSATVLAYHLLTHGEVDREVLARGLPRTGRRRRREVHLPRADGGVRRVVEVVAAGNPTVSSMPSSEPAARGVPIGLFHRANPDGAGRVRRQLVAGDPSRRGDGGRRHRRGGAVAGSCFVQAGPTSYSGRRDRRPGGGDDRGGAVSVR
jgi:hypothetical protein